MKRMFSFLILSIMLLGMLAACGTTATTPAPATGATTAPAAGAATTAPAGATTAPAGATPAMPVATPAMPAGNAEVTLWHAYGTGSSEEEALTELIANAQKAMPQAKITVLQIPFDSIYSKFENEVSAGGGPDMFLAPNDSLGSQVRKNLLLPLDDKLSGKLTNISPTAIEGMKVDGKLYAVPESLKAVALYYNTATVSTPPATTDELLAAVKGGKKLVLNQSIYHNFGFLQSFGGKLFDANNKCAAASGGAEALQFLKDLKAAGATFSTDGGQADSLFKEGKADMIINGPWALGDYRKALGAEKLGVAAVPAGPKGKGGPLTGVDGFYVNINSKNPDAAVALALFLTSPESQSVYTEKAGHVPANTTVKITDKNVQGFADASATGVPRPQTKELDSFWEPFGNAVTKVMEGVSEPAAAITEACTAMDAANAK